MLFSEYSDKTKPTIVLLHGGGLSDWSTRPVAERLNADYRVILPIIDGHGANGETTFESIEESAKRLIAYIDSCCGSSVRLLAGLSLGAQIVAQAMSERPGIAQFAVLESALVIPMRIAAASAPLYRPLHGLIRLRWFARLQAQALNLPEYLFEQYFADSTRLTAQSLINITKSNAGYALKESISKTQAKTLILAGEREIGVMRRSAQMLHQAIPGSTLQLLPRMRHGEYSLLHPDAYAAALLRLMGSTP